MITKIVNTVSNLIWEKALFGRPGSLRILTYHGIVEKYQDRFLERNFITYKEFNSELDFLAKKFNFISIPEILEKKGKFSNEIAITFDDGYENNIIAAEVLLKRRIPFTIFLTTNAIGAKGKSIWPVDLSLLLLKGRLDNFYLFNRVWHLNDPNERKSVFNEVRELFKKLKSEDRVKFFAELSIQYPENELELLHNDFTSFKMLSLNQARELSQIKLCNLGCHGYQHEILHANQNEITVEFEIKSSIQQFESYFGYRPNHFAYPNGDSSAIAEKMIAESGFTGAFLNKPLLLENITNNFRIPRLNTPNNLKACKQAVNHY